MSLTLTESRQGVVNEVCFHLLRFDNVCPALVIPALPPRGDPGAPCGGPGSLVLRRCSMSITPTSVAQAPSISNDCSAAPIKEDFVQITSLSRK